MEILTFSELWLLFTFEITEDFIFDNPSSCQLQKYKPTVSRLCNGFRARSREAVMGSEHSCNRQKGNTSLRNHAEKSMSTRKIYQWPGNSKAEKPGAWDISSEARANTEWKKWEEERQRLVNNCIFIDF